MTYTHMMEAVKFAFPNYTRVLFSYPTDNESKKSYVLDEITENQPQEAMFFKGTIAYIYTN